MADDQTDRAPGRARRTEESVRLEADAVEEQLRGLILSMELAPGEVISRSQMAIHLLCGLSPLRLALERLVEQGLVVSAPRRGYVISGLNLSEFGDLFEFTADVMVSAARMAARRCTAEDAATLEQIVVRMKESSGCGDARGYVQWDRELNLAVARASGNRYVFESANKMVGLLQRYILASAQAGDPGHASERATAWESEVRPLIDALRDRDVESAGRRMREHFAASRERVRAFL